MRGQPVVLRETEHYIVMRTPKCHARIIAKDHKSCPSSEIVSDEVWRQLKGMSSAEFDATVVLEVGIGTWRKP